MGKYVKRIVMEMIIILQKDKTILIAANELKRMFIRCIYITHKNILLLNIQCIECIQELYINC